MGLNTFDGDVQVRGTLKTVAFSAPASCIGDSNVDGSSPITAAKLQHQYQRTYQQSNGSATVADQSIRHIVYGATGSVVAVSGGFRTACVAPSKATVDIKKNGTSILSSPFDITSASAAFAQVSGAIATAALVVGDVLEVVITVTGGGTQGQGIFVNIVIREDAA